MGPINYFIKRLISSNILKLKYYRHENRVKKRTLVYVLKIWKVDDSKKDVEPID